MGERTLSGVKAIVASQQHHEAVDAGGNPAVRWCAVLERLQQVSEPLLNLGVGVAQQVENLVLQVAPMDTNAAAGEFVSVAHEVIAVGAYLARVGLQQGDVFLEGRGERVVRRVPATLLFVPLQQREVHHPRERHQVRVCQSELLSHAVAQAAEALVGDLWRVGDNREEVAHLSACALANRLQLALRKELRNRRAHPIGGEGDGCQPLRAEPLDELGQLVELFA